MAAEIWVSMRIPGDSEAAGHGTALGDPVLRAGEGIHAGTDLSDAQTRLNFQSHPLES